jgi:hypothetical protein
MKKWRSRDWLTSSRYNIHPNYVCVRQINIRRLQLELLTYVSKKALNVMYSFTIHFVEIFSVLL